MEFLVDGLNLTKTTKKKLDKLNKINIHLHGKNQNGCPLLPESSVNRFDR
jgi:hypothetical protein